jgi:hypothetical protein
VQRSILLRFFKELVFMKTLALVLALAFAAPLAAQAATSNGSDQTVAQKVQSTYHTNFSNSGN